MDVFESRINPSDTTFKNNQDDMGGADSYGQAEFVRQKDRNGIATVALARPDLHNAFNEVMIAEITEAFGRMSGNGCVSAAGQVRVSSWRA